MVNVAVPFPFNLHNQVLGEPSSSRSTRSVSGGTANDSRQRSPSPHRVIQKSYSSTSLRQHLDDSSLNLLGEFDDDPDARRPILNVKLVQGAARIGAPRGGQARGRGRLGRFGEEGVRWARAAVTEPELEKDEVPPAAVLDTEPGHEYVEESTPRSHAAQEQEHASGLQAVS
ncbi:hypothetical protein SERLADRAFT_408195 [Serpula lacrymans var. lacrymans S7.9]|uniref:Uncharacterized protein n=1 Tax=Serpula lacrymans var. lacrymans (strain S7.9) TaxID=578457 RepID=F8NVC6_SERL9|nr:uncharacterized protein SERLADRAFT_408195 [Serpula lacrymans var. lacrymans S7.9]EGO26027.1 hypothetical protein SERLADRAFT_408195 [Serpula lacrymans var. lacrymans S7.9]